MRCSRGRSAWTQRYELRLKVLTHNLMLLLRIQIFYRASATREQVAAISRLSLAEEG